MPCRYAQNRPPHGAQRQRFHDDGISIEPKINCFGVAVLKEHDPVHHPDLVGAGQEFLLYPRLV